MDTFRKDHSAKFLANSTYSILSELDASTLYNKIMKEIIVEERIEDRVFVGTLCDQIRYNKQMDIMSDVEIFAERVRDHLA